MKIQRLLAGQVGQDDFEIYCANKGISWVTIPTRVPHFDGLWEAGVRRMRRLFRGQMGRIVLSFEELATILAHIEQIRNSRPLTPLSTVPNDVQVLTPGHFLVGSPLTALPSGNKDDTQAPGLQSWRMIQLLLQRLWKRWTREFILTNQIRTKWQHKKTNLAVNDLVFVTDDNNPPLYWPLGRVVAVYTGNDDLNRVARVKTQNGYINRPISKLRVLPLMAT